MLRTVALVAIAGQLQLLPAAIACAAEHGRPAGHCGEAMLETGPALSAGHDGPASPLCTLGMGCMATSVAVAPAAAAESPDVASFDVTARAVLVPPSFDSSPAPPPPQV